MKSTAVSIAALLATVLAAPAARAGSDEPAPYMERSDRAVEAAGISAVDVDNPRGRVELSSSPDGRLHVTATKVCRLSRRDEAQRYAAETTVETAVRNGRFTVTVHYPHRIESHVNFWDLFSEHGRRGLHLPIVEVRLELQVPASLPASVVTASGDIATHALAGAQSFRTSSGDLEAHAARGPIEARTESGDITLRGVAGARVRTISGDVSVEGAGALEANTTSGNIEVRGAREALVLQSVSGDIVVADAPAGVRAHTTSGEVVLHSACAGVDAGTQSGDIRARVRAPLLGSHVSSASGNVELELVSGLGATLDARSVSGSIDCSAPVSVIQHGRNSFQARLGPGGAPVRIETTSGNVTITSGGK